MDIISLLCMYSGYVIVTGSRFGDLRLTETEDESAQAVTDVVS